jgi:hypothetical protein
VRGMHANQGPYRKIAPALDDFNTWCIKCDPDVGESQRAHNISEMKTTSSASTPSTITD